MKQCLKILTVINIIFALFAPISSFAVSDTTNVDLEVIKEIEKPVPQPRPPQPIVDIIPPTNVSNFEAIPGDRQITLKWQNPPDPDFKAVRIMRSESFYPKDPWEGTLVYDDRGTSFVDTGLINGKRYYYTAFSYDFSGNFSSGAIASAVPWPPEIPPPVIPPPPEIIPPVVPPPPEVEKITLEDFDFIQEGKKIPIIDGKIKIKRDIPLEISIDYEKVPEVLKTITVTLEKNEKFFSFLLRINKEKTAYSAVLMPPEEPGIYPLTITILDYKNQTLKRIFGQLIVPRAPISWCKIWPYILLALIMLALIAYFVKRKLKKKRKKSRMNNESGIRQYE